MHHYTTEKYNELSNHFPLYQYQGNKQYGQSIKLRPHYTGQIRQTNVTVTEHPGRYKSTTNDKIYESQAEKKTKRTCNTL